MTVLLANIMIVQQTHPLKVTFFLAHKRASSKFAVKALFFSCLKIKSLHLRADSLKCRAAGVPTRYKQPRPCTSVWSKSATAGYQRSLTQIVSAFSFLLLLSTTFLAVFVFYHLLCVLLSLRVYNFMLRLMAILKNAHTHTLIYKYKRRKKFSKIMYVMKKYIKKNVLKRLKFQKQFKVLNKLKCLVFKTKSHSGEM